MPEVRIARQLSMGYLQFNIMEHEQLLEKHAKVLGIAEIKVAWNTLNSPAAMNDALKRAPWETLEFELVPAGKGA